MELDPPFSLFLVDCQQQEHFFFILRVSYAIIGCAFNPQKQKQCNVMQCTVSNENVRMDYYKATWAGLN